ncbi:hypothetical protein CWI38_1097p0010 [Hamiltosporidium tvaerminnensis]|uniref:SF3 helicase domain-containing protein n=1 Tax=Hamiltosporidium tvaerminnensis TaxID=1176355 RepID=A0A4Q9LTM4_9MICR|nr:hypothetical protein CWI38_1097p0010 [Hamiltosporidium tvaerminnensis]
MEIKTNSIEEPESEFEIASCREEPNEETLICGYTTSIYGKRMTIVGKDSFLAVYKNEISKGYFNEYLRESAKVVLFFDLDSKDFELTRLVQDIKTLISNYFIGFDTQFIVTDATGREKFSKHMLVRLFKDEKAYVFRNVGEVLNFVRENLRLDGVDLNVYKPGGCLLRAFGASKERVSRKLLLDLKNTGPIKDIQLIDHFVQWPGELGECLGTFISKKSVACFKEVTPRVTDSTAIAKVEEPRENQSINNVFVKILDFFKFKAKKIYRPRYSEIKDGVLIVYVDLEPLDVCPYNVVHKSNKTYLRITVISAILKCHGCRLKTTLPVLETRLTVVLSHDEIYLLFKGSMRKKRSRVGSPERVQELLGVSGLEEESYHNLSTVAYSIVSKDNTFNKPFQKDRNIVACQSELKKFSKNFVEINNRSYMEDLEETFSKPEFIELVYDQTYFSKQKLENDLDSEDFFLRVFLDSPTPVLFARFLTVVLKGRALVCKENLYLANMYNVYKEYTKVDTIGILSYFTEQFLKSLEYSRKILKEQHSLKECKDGLFSKYLRMRMSLESPHFIRAVMCVLFPYLRDEAKGLTFDTKFSLIPLKKSVFDYQLRKIRKIELEDYISFTLEYSEEDMLFSDNRTLAYKFMENIFKDEVEIEYVLNELRIILFQKSNDKIYFLIGEGANGKTTFVNMLRKALCGLVGELPVEALSSTKSSGMNPFVVNLRKCRIGIVAENGTQILQVDMIKRLAGCETITVRTLYSNPVIFPFNTRLLLIANNLPKFSAIVDYALSRRMMYIYFAKNLSIKENIKYNLDLKNETVRDAIGLGFCEIPGKGDKANTLKYVYEKPEYSFKLTEFKAFAKSKICVDETHTRSSDGKSIRAFIRPQLNDNLQTRN